MSRPGSGTRTAPTLRRTWLVTVTTLLAIVVGLAALALGITQYQRAQVSATATGLERSTEAMLELERRIFEQYEPMFGVLYGFRGDDERRAEAVEAYAEARERTRQAFDDAADALGDGRAAAELEEIRQIWAEIDAVVDGAEDNYTDEQLEAFFEEEHDPYRTTVWEPAEDMGEQLGEVRRAGNIELTERVSAMERTQGYFTPVILVAVALALLLTVLAVRRMSHRVLAPLTELGERARAMHHHALPELRIETPGAAAEIQELAGVLSDAATSQRDHTVELHRQARTDPLTGLPNRQAFSEALEALVDSSRVQQLAVLFIDLDDFKDVNDRLGHAAGDELLTIVAERLRSGTRGCEIAARLGGDEFAVAVDVSKDRSVAVTVAERLRERISGAAQLGSHQVRTGCSVGIAVGDARPPADETADELLRNADIAMYLAKSQGKGRHELYAPGLHTELQARVDLGRDLTMAVERDQFVLHYQPVLDLESERLIGFEALVRWEHPQRGLLPPAAFLPLAEDGGTIIEIGAWVFDRACAMLARLHEHDSRLTMAINVSSRQLTDPAIVGHVLEAADRHGVDPRCLVLEVTEATAVTTTEAGAAALASLRAAGVGVALDDVGSGYSSLRYLGDLPVDMLKIDGSVVAGHDEDHARALEGIVRFAQHLDLPVVAEGIESPEDRDRLRGFHELRGQGYLLARPMPEGEALEAAAGRLQVAE